MIFKKREFFNGTVIFFLDTSKCGSNRILNLRYQYLQKKRTAQGIETSVEAAWSVFSLYIYNYTHDDSTLNIEMKCYERIILFCKVNNSACHCLLLHFLFYIETSGMIKQWFLTFS